MTIFHKLRLLILAFLLVPTLASAAEVKNVQLFQEGNRAVFTYDLVGDETSDQVKLTLTVGGQQYAQDKLHLSGDIGAVRPGTEKKIVWDVLQDFPRGVGGEMSWVLEGSGSGKRFADNGNATVTDHQTGLVWQQEDDGEMRNWKDAGRYCAQLSLGGRSDWRLPDDDELTGIVDNTRSNPAIDPVFFETKSSDYWSSTSDADYPSHAWGVAFGYSGVEYVYKVNYLYVRCVR